MLSQRSGPTGRVLNEECYKQTKNIIQIEYLFMHINTEKFCDFLTFSHTKLLEMQPLSVFEVFFCSEYCLYDLQNRFNNKRIETIMTAIMNF